MANSLVLAVGALVLMMLRACASVMCDVKVVSNETIEDPAVTFSGISTPCVVVEGTVPLTEIIIVSSSAVDICFSISSVVFAVTSVVSTVVCIEALWVTLAPANVSVAVFCIFVSPSIVEDKEA